MKTKKNIKDILALTPMQEGMLFHYLKSPQNDHYFEQLCLNLSGHMDFHTMELAWNDVVEHNDMLRAFFKWDNVKQPLQVVLKEHRLEFNVLEPLQAEAGDCIEGESSDHQQRLEAIKATDRKRKFDLQNVPIRVTVGKLTNDRGFMLISHHHILFDGWSNGIILKDFFEAYNTRLQGKTATKQTKGQFKHYVKWLKDLDKEKQAAFWKDYLKGYHSACQLPGKKISSGIDGKTTEVHVRLDVELKNKADRLVKDLRITLASLLYVSWGIMLQRYTGTEDVVIGTTVSGRSARVEGVEDIVGLFINTLPLRIQSNCNEGVEDLLLRVDKALKSRQEHDHTPLTDIKMAADIEGRGEPFDTILALENYPLDKTLIQEKSALSADSFSMRESTHYDMTVGILVSDTIDIKFISNDAVLPKTAVRSIADHFCRIFTAAVEHHHLDTTKLEMLSLEEKQQLLVEFNNTTRSIEDKNIHEVFADHVAKAPDAIALTAVAHQSDSGTGIQKNSTPAYRRDFHKTAVSLTYRELDEQALQLAVRLQDSGVRPNTIVALALERSLEMIIGIMGVIKAGGAYLPIDPKTPGERASYILLDSKALLLVTTQSISRTITVKIDRLFMNVAENTESPQGLEFPYIPKVPALKKGRQLAYVIYTSGTTGKPKGTMIPHGNVVRFIKSMDYLELTYRDRMLQVADYTFDISVFNTYAALLSGAELVVPQREDFSALERLADIAIKKDITSFFMPTGLFNALVEVKLEMFAGIRNILVGGERVSPSHSRKVLDYFDNNADGNSDKSKRKNRLINGYGPTETTVYSTYYFINKIEENAANVPIGRPVPNTTVYVADKNKN
ncbi:MAG: AMP-binding protein, partial [bacterium]|nr:AMP-binding protein [bacterium]